MTPRYPCAAIAIAMLASSGCIRTPPRSGTVPEPAIHRLSTKAQRQSLSIALYNHDFGLVREVRQVELGPGRVDLDYRDVAARVEPASVHLRPGLAGQRLQVLEQNFRHGGLDPRSLLKAYVGKVIYVTRFDEGLGREVKKPAKVLACEPNIVLEIDGVVRTDFRFEVPGTRQWSEHGHVYHSSQVVLAVVERVSQSITHVAAGHGSRAVAAVNDS